MSRVADEAESLLLPATSTVIRSRRAHQRPVSDLSTAGGVFADPSLLSPSRVCGVAARYPEGAGYAGAVGRG